MQRALYLSGDASPEVQIKLKYAYVALAALWAYDYVTTLDEEFSFVVGSSWRIAKFLYLACRYLPFVYLGATMFRTQDQHPMLSMCQTYYSLNSYIGGAIILAAESIFFVRTYAIWGRSKWIVWVFIATVILILTPIVVILVEYNSSTVVVNFIAPGVPGCSKIGETSIVFVVYVLIVIVETEILLLTLYRAIMKYQRRREGINVLTTLLQHNIFYYACGLISSVLLIFAITVFPASYSDFASSTQITAHAILVTRMHRKLWKSNEDFTHTEAYALTTLAAAVPYQSLGRGSE